MSEVLLKFEREHSEGIVAAGTYLIDAAGRFGINIDDFRDGDGVHSCGVVVKTGSELLSPLTKVEREHFSRHGRRNNERLACQTKIDKPGEVIIMTDEKKKKDAEEESSANGNERFRKEFEEMPLEKKIANLLQLEFMALGETVTFVMNSPFKVFDKVLDVMAEFGFKKDEAAKEANRPEEHKTGSKSKSGGSKAPGKTSGGRDAPAAG